MKIIESYKHFDQIAFEYDRWKKKNWYYYDQLKELFRNFIPEDKRVLEIGCGTGEILNAVNPSYGVGIDLSKNMIEIARSKFLHLRFQEGAAEKVNGIIENKKNFDYIIMSDLVEHLDDIQAVLTALKNICNKETKIIISTPNSLWQPLLKLGEKLRLKMPEGPHNWVSIEIIENILTLSSFKIIESGFRIPTPKKIPFISSRLEKILPRINLLRRFCWITYVLAVLDKETEKKEYTCSVIIPCKNEAENIIKCIEEIPNMGKEIEIIVVNDGSTDHTLDLVRQIMKRDKRIRLVSYQPSHGKGYAIQQGFKAANGDVFIIFDADITVPPEELPRFYNALAEGKCRFANGTRNIYPMEKQAMPGLNLFGNKIFAFLFTLILGQRITDTLCGTKAFLREDYLQVNFSHSNWGDFTLLLNAALSKLKIMEVPVHYKRRLHGLSKMRPLKHGFILLGMIFWIFWKVRIISTLKKKANL